MSVQTSLDRLPRAELIERARAAGAERAELMTRVELIDEIVRRSTSDEQEKRRARGWLGVARDLVASVVAQGLHLPDAAKVIRGGVRLDARVQPTPVATVTLAEIYAAQGHPERALELLDEVLAEEPDHEQARKRRDRMRRELFGEEAARDTPPANQTEPGGGEERSAAPPAGDAAGPSAADEIRTAPTPEREHADESEDNVSAAAAERADDMVALIRASDEQLYVHWELRPATLGWARGLSARGALTLRVVSAVASWDGAELSERDVALEAERGTLRLDGLSRDTVARAAVGWKDGSQFVPLVVGAELKRTSDRLWEVGFSPRPRDSTRPHPAELRAALAFEQLSS
ncbi:MAG TPA: tetratricopeptide repeat protein [Polyangiaceae bacterium]|jgi:hypothetical protein